MKIKLNPRLIGKLVDIDSNLVHPDLVGSFKAHVENAITRGVECFVVPGSTLADSVAAIALVKDNPTRFRATAGVHPYHTLACPFTPEIIGELDTLIQTESLYISCIGECGLDYSEGFPPREVQLPWFRHQVELSIKYRKPLYLHIRKAHEDAISILRELLPASHSPSDVPIGVVHCFTGSHVELKEYVELGFYIGLTGYVINTFKQPEKSTTQSLEDLNISSSSDKILDNREEDLGEWLNTITLSRLMIETDAPYMGFPGCRVSEQKKKTSRYPNVPSSLPLVAEFIQSKSKWSMSEVIEHSTINATQFFDFPDALIKY